MVYINGCNFFFDNFLIFSPSLEVTNRAVVTQRPAWHKLYGGETVTLTCDIEDGADTEWEYEWALPSSYPSYTRYEYRIKFLTSSYIGDYRCMGRVKGGGSTTDWSDVLTLTLSGKSIVNQAIIQTCIGHVSVSWPAVMHRIVFTGLNQ